MKDFDSKFGLQIRTEAKPQSKIGFFFGKCVFRNGEENLPLPFNISFQTIREVFLSVGYLVY